MSDQNNGNGREEQRVRTFNPNEHLIQLKSKDGLKDYLPVQWRLVWFRMECPQGTIDTEELEFETEKECFVETFVWNNEKKRSEKTIKTAKGYARYRAVVTDGKGGRGTGTKAECRANFEDYGEKAETGAIGRALAALGYGTQFAPELDEQHRIVDAPVDRGAPSTGSNGYGRKTLASVQPPVTGNTGKTNGAASEEGAADAPATEQQLNSIRKLCQHLGKPEPENPDTLSYLDAKELITQLSHEYNEQKQHRKAS
jgi:hypothetical protein